MDAFAAGRDTNCNGRRFRWEIVIASIAGAAPVRLLSRGDQCIAKICA